MIDILKQELDKRGVFTTPIPKFLTELTKTIANPAIPDKMKLTIAISEVILFCSQFRRNILHPNNSLIPINAISFAISASGTGKDSSVSSIRKTFDDAYEKINEIRNQKAINDAIEKASKDKKANSFDPKVYLGYYKEPLPLFAALSTNEGFIAHLNKLDSDGIGSGYIFSGEFGSDLLTSSTIVPNIQLLSELYDEGKKEVKIIKDNERQSKPIKNLPVSALFMGSQINILFDDTIKNKFKTEFSSKLARRSFFNYNPTLPKLPSFENLSEFLDFEKTLNSQALNTMKSYREAFLNVANTQLGKLGIPIPVSKEANELMTIYKRYNIEQAEKVKNIYPITKIVLNHLYWKALKLSGAFAILRDNSEITEQDYKEAIAFTELLSKDMMEFEIELVKEPYELFSSYVNTALEDNKCFVSLHSLKKLGYITGSTNLTAKIKELAHLCSSYDANGIYKASDRGIEFTKLVTSDIIGISYIKCKGSKEERKQHCASGYIYMETNFSELAEFLKMDIAYTPFNFKNGVRGKENVEGSIKWLALDIDKSDFTDTQMHEILKEFNHHIVRTSDNSNAHKFRVLLELDVPVDLDDISYKKFTLSIAEYLGLDIDPLPKSQIFFSYSGRKVLSITDKNCIEVKPHLINTYENSKKVELNTLSKEQKSALLNDKLTTFRYAFEARQGEGSVSLIRAAKHARDLGMSKDEVLGLMIEINNYWDYPMDTTRFQRDILNQIKRWEF